MAYRNILNAVFLLFFMAALSLHTAVAAVAAPEKTTSMAFSLRWNSLPFGLCKVTLSESSDKFRSSAHIAMSGIAQMISPHESTTTLEGDGSASATSARVYDTRYSTRGKEKHVRIEYSKGGKVKNLLLEPPDNPAKRPPPALAQLTGVADPLVFITELRAALKKALTSSKSTITLMAFDGRRLFETTWYIQGEQKLKLNGQSIPVIRAMAKRNPIAGFTEKELTAFKTDPPLTAYFDKETLLPVKLVVDFWFGPVEAVWQDF